MVQKFDEGKCDVIWVSTILMNRVLANHVDKFLNFVLIIIYHSLPHHPIIDHA